MSGEVNGGATRGSKIHARSRIWRIAEQLRKRAADSIAANAESPNQHQSYYADTDADLDMEAYLLIRELVTYGVPPAP